MDVSNPNSSTISTTAQLIQFNPTSQLPIKLLGSHNFTTWKAQFELLLHGYDLFGHLDGSLSAPPATITTGDKTSPNPEYQLWFRQNKLIHNALLASVDPTLASTVATASDAHTAWQSLHTSFANKSQTRIFSLRDQLSKVSKANRSVVEYLRDIKSISDELATAGSPVSNAELVIKILSGLGSEYNPLASAIRARESPISYEELFDQLLNHELFLKYTESHQPSAPNLTIPATAAIAQRGPYPDKFSAPGHRPPPQRNYHNQARNTRMSGTSWQNQSFPSSNKVRCQLCSKFGHTANVCRSKSHNHMEARANLAQSAYSSPWVVDSGASHHITNDVHNFQSPQDYTGPEELTMGDGKSIAISHTGNTSLRTSNHQFTLSNTLCAPDIKTNLISVSQFCQDNNTSIEFFPSSFHVKDLVTGTALVCGQNKNGLYEWPVAASPPTAYSSQTHSSLHLWHQRLGHPNFKALKLVLNSISVPCNSANLFSCDSCCCNKSHRLPFFSISLNSNKPL